MTSTASQQNQISAPTPSAPTTSYASAAGATKKPTSTPLSATGSHPPVVVGSSVPTAQNGKPSATAPVNGRPNITPAVPAVSGPPPIARSSVMNGGAADHARKSSVTISANAPSSHIANGGPVGANKVMPQFGFNESPAITHSTPQITGAQPIPIPGSNPRIQSPAHSPSPIPQIPQQSGGQRAPSSTQVPVTFGSFSGEPDRHMKQHSISHPAGQSPHARRDSQASAHNESVGHGGPGHRGGFQGQGRGRGGYNSGYNNPNMGGYPPNRPYSGPNGGRGGMPPYHQGRGGMQQFPNSPQPPHASPATTPAMPRHGTPTMTPATLAAQTPPYYAQGMNPMFQHQQVKPPFITNDSTFKQGKKGKGARRDSDKSYHSRPSNPPQKSLNSELTHRSRRNSKRWESVGEYRRDMSGGLPPYDHVGDGPPASYAFAATRPVPMHHSSLYAPHFMSHLTGQIDLSPASGNFEQLLTEQQKQMNPYGVPPPQMEGYRGGMMVPNYAYPPPTQMPYMGQPPQATPAYHQPYAPPYAQAQPAAQAMSRNPSQVSDRPTSSTGPSQAPVITQGTPHQRPAQPAAPAIVSSSTFARPKKSTPIVIKDAQGNPVNFSNVKAPASPSPSIQQSKTPPVIASTPTPPPKPTTPSHARTESAAAAKTAEEVRNEFKDAVRKTTEGPSDAKVKEEEAAKAAAEKAAAEKAAAEEKAKEEERRKEEERLAAKKKAEEEAKAAAEKAAKEKAEAEAKAKAEAEAKLKAETEAAEKAAAEKASKEAEDEEFERMIREMEEEDARREKEQAEISAKKQVEEAERKKREEADRLANAAENDRKLREQEREMERLEEEKERKRKEAEAKGAPSVADLLSKKMDELEISDKKDTPATTKPETLSSRLGAAEKKGKPVPLNLSPINTGKAVEPPQPSAALQSLKTSRFLGGVEYDIYPAGIHSPNPALNTAVAKKGKVFKYDAQFLLQFQTVFTEQPSLEFGQQVKTLIGDSDGNRSASARTPSARSGSRAGPSGGFPQQGAMGQFGAAKTLPPGTTSEQRFAMSQGGGSMPRPGIGGMAFGRPGAFPNQLSRTPSSTNAGGIPGSPRQGSRRGGSKRADFSSGKAEAQAAKTMPLTQGMEVKPITVSATGWKPTSVGRPGPAAAAAAAQPGHLDPEMVQRKVKAALNKMTPEKFDKIADSILAIASQSKNEQDGRTLRQVIQLTFEKATDEAHWASMYAKFCKRMLETMSPEIRDENILDKAGNVVSGGALFRKYLLNRCQEEFERGWKVDLPEPKKGEKKAGEAELLSDEYYIAAAAKRRGLGLVQFIGELFKLGMLTERIMHECVRKLLEFQGVPDEAEIESLTKLLRTVGGVLDSTDKGRPMMEAYFQRIDSIIQLPDLPSRLKFMLMDIVDLRKARWASKDNNKGPKTLEEVRAEAEAQAAQKAAESARNNQRGGPGGRPSAGRGDARSFSQFTQAPPNQVQMDDLRRLKAPGSRSASQNTSFGPTSMFNSRSNSGRRLAPGGAFGRAGDDSGASSRTGTPPTRERESVAHTNAFGLLADTGENPASPPSTAASPALSKAALDTAVSSDEKKE